MSPDKSRWVERAICDGYGLDAIAERVQPMAAGLRETLATFQT